MIEQAVQRPWEELKSSIVGEEQTTERRVEDTLKGLKNKPGKNSTLKISEHDSKGMPIEQKAHSKVTVPVTGRRWTEQVQGTHQEAGAEISVL